jgi:hypothetical protein
MDDEPSLSLGFMDDEPSLSLGFMDDDPSIHEELACSRFLIVGFLLPEILVRRSPISILGRGSIGNNQPKKKKKKPHFLHNSYLPPKPHTFLAQYFNTCPKGKKGQDMKKIIERTKN